jgi:autophagy-related protein 5
MTTPLTTQIWTSTIPLHLTLAPSLHPPSGPPLPFFLHVPRISYLPLLLPRLSAFFGVTLSSFTYEGIELRLLPAGLLADLYAPELPWRIEVGNSWGVGERGVADGFMNSVKEVRCWLKRHVPTYAENYEMRS